MPSLLRSLAVILFLLVVLLGCDSASVNSAAGNINLPDVKISDPSPTDTPLAQGSAAAPTSAPTVPPSPTESPVAEVPVQPAPPPQSLPATPGAPPSMILCRKTGGLSANHTKLTFRPDHCDKGLPDANYYGFPLALTVAGAMYEFQVEQPGDEMIFSPSVHLYLANGQTADSYEIRVLYIRKQTTVSGKPNLIACSRTESSNTALGKTTFDHSYRNEECGGMKPDLQYTGTPVAVLFDTDPGELRSFKMAAGRISITTNSYRGSLTTQSLFYLAPAVTCSFSSVSINFYQTSVISFGGAECDQGKPPAQDTFSIPTAISVQNGYSGFVLEQPITGENDLNLIIKAIGGVGGAYFSTASFPLEP